MPLFPPQTTVKLSDGTIAEVESYNKDDMLNPKLRDLNGEEIEMIEGLKVAHPIKKISDTKRLKHL